MKAVLSVSRYVESLSLSQLYKTHTSSIFPHWRSWSTYYA